MSDFKNIIENMDVLAKLRHLIMSDFQPSVDAKHILKPSEYRTLFHLSVNEGKPMNYYCEKVELEKGSFTYLADRLELYGYIKRVDNKDDRRRKILFLTDEGRRITDELEIQFKKHIAKKFDLFSKEEKKKLISAMEVLKEIKTSLEKKLSDNEQHKKS